jgi:hypothetical protein
MAASSTGLCASAAWSPRTGLRPEPQGVRTLAAGAALKIGDEARSRARYGKTVFDRHSTQSLIAAGLRLEPPKLKELAVDSGVYKGASFVDESQPIHRQAPEYTGSRRIRRAPRRRSAASSVRKPS